MNDANDLQLPKVERPRDAEALVYALEVLGAALKDTRAERDELACELADARHALRLAAGQLRDLERAGAGVREVLGRVEDTLTPQKRSAPALASRGADAAGNQGSHEARDMNLRSEPAECNPTPPAIRWVCERCARYHDAAVGRVGDRKWCSGCQLGYMVACAHPAGGQAP